MPGEMTRQEALERFQNLLLVFDGFFYEQEHCSGSNKRVKGALIGEFSGVRYDYSDEKKQTYSQTWYARFEGHVIGLELIQLSDQYGFTLLDEQRRSIRLLVHVVAGKLNYPVYPQK